MDDTEFDRRADAITLEPTSQSFGQRCGAIIFKITMAVLAFTLAIFWTDTIRDIYAKYCPITKGTISYSLTLSIIITVITIAIAVIYSKSTP